MKNEFQLRETIQDEIALSQLRHILNVSTNYEVQGHALAFDYHDDRCTLEQINDHLILKPGTQIFFSRIDQASFFEQNACIYIQYERKNNHYERILIKT